MQFILEKATTTLSFLDMKLKINGNSFDTWVYRKSTHTNVLLNFNALVSMKWKTGLIFCLIHHASSICLKRELFNKECDNTA